MNVFGDPPHKSNGRRKYMDPLASGAVGVPFQRALSIFVATCLAVLAPADHCPR
jgi:hypothetical protein